MARCRGTRAVVKSFWWRRKRVRIGQRRQGRRLMVTSGFKMRVLPTTSSQHAFLDGFSICARLSERSPYHRSKPPTTLRIRIVGTIPLGVPTTFGDTLELFRHLFGVVVDIRPSLARACEAESNDVEPLGIKRREPNGCPASTLSPLSHTLVLDLDINRNAAARPPELSHCSIVEL